MGKWIIYAIMMLAIIHLAFAIDECKGTMNSNEIPCFVLLPYKGDCTNIGIRFYKNATVLLDDRLMVQYSPFTCNQTFNYTSYGTYTFNYSTGDSGSIVVEEDENQQYYLYVVVLTIFFVLVGLGYWKEEGVFVMVAGMLATAIGINIYINGFPNLTNTFLKTAVAMAIWGIGAYLILAPAIQFFKSWRESE